MNIEMTDEARSWVESKGGTVVVNLIYWST